LGKFRQKYAQVTQHSFVGTTGAVGQGECAVGKGALDSRSDSSGLDDSLSIDTVEAFDEPLRVRLSSLIKHGNL
jgi:hypothetical protein